MSNRKITTRLLRSRGACAEQVTAFRALWPRGVVPRLELAREHATTFDWQWAAEHLLGPAALAEYARVRATAWAKYVRVTGAARAEYVRVRAEAWAEYKRVTAPTWAEYTRVRATALAEYKRVTAEAFVTAWLKDGSDV